MRLTITIDLDGAAFDVFPETETQRILEDLAETLQDLSTGMPAGDAGQLRDSNGNTCGEWRVIDNTPDPGFAPRVPQ